MKPMKIIVLTCNGHKFLVPIFMHFYKKYWPDNPYQTEIVTETDRLDGTVFYAGKVSWSNALINYLKQSKEDKFLLILEDYIIKNTIDTKRIERAESLCKGNVGCVRLYTPDIYFTRHAVHTDICEDFKEYPLDKPFSVSLQIAIWQKQFLLDILRDGENPWQFEVDGSERLKKLVSKWQILYSEIPIIEYRPGGLLKRGRPRLGVVMWALSDLLKDLQI